MTIASEIIDLQTNLSSAKAAVTAKGGTVGDTGLAGLANEIASIPAGSGASEPGGDARITGYNTSTGEITGSGFGSTAGIVYLLDRDTHTYVSQPVSSWGITRITLTTPIDISTIEGTTSLVVVTADGIWSTKWLITGQITVSGWGKAYIKNFDTGAVRTITLNSTSDFNQFTTQNNRWSEQKTIGGDTFYLDEVVGIQFGSSYTDTTIYARTFQYLVNLNQPIVIPNTVTFMSDNFMGYCSSFNQPLIIPNTITSIANNFLMYCYSFNQPITIHATGNYFMYGCSSFNQPITISSDTTSISTYFLYQCRSFNQPITIPNTVTSIGTYFLAQCDSFNQTITLPNNITTIQDNFLYNGSSFNQPITLPNSVTTIGNSFLSGMPTFNQSITIPSSVTSIGNNFLSNCKAFNTTLTIPSTVTSIGNNFLQNTYGFSKLVAETTSSPIDTSSLSSNYNTAKIYVKGVTITGSGASTWISNLPNSTSSPFRKLVAG